MIIECKTCHARFRLDESKIKGRGARVKCRKCGEPIVVLKDVGSGTLAQEPGGEGSLDLSSALRESSGEGIHAVKTPPPDNLIHFPGPAARATEHIAASGKDEVDIAFEQLLAGTPDEPTTAAPPEPPAVPPFEPPAAPTFEESAAPTFEPPAAPTFEEPADLTFEVPAVPTFEPPADLTFEPPAAPTFEEPATPTFEPPVDLTFEPPADLTLAPPPEEKFFIGDAETMNLLQEEERATGSGGDISLSIVSNPVETEAPFTLESTSFSPSPAAKPADAAAEKISVEGNVTPPSESREIDAPPYREEEEEPGPASVGSAPFREPAPMPAPARSGSSFARIAGVVLLLALLSAAGYFGFTATGRKTLDSVSPRIAALLGGKTASKAVSRYDVKNVIGYFDSGAASSRILVIKGQVTNLSSGGKSGIKVFASLLDNTGKVLAEQAVYAGNVVPGARLKTEDRATLEKALANPLGEHLANMDVLPGKIVPFMVLFFDAPEDIDSYRLEAKDTQ